MTGRPKRKGNETGNGTQTKAKQKSLPDISSENNRKDQDKNKSRNKIFLERNSVLTAAVENPHIRAIRNLSISFYLSWLLYIVVGKYLRENELSIPGLSILASGFVGTPAAIALWFAMFASTVIFFGFFKTWASLRAWKRLLILDLFATACLVSYVAAFFVLPLYPLLTWDIGMLWRSYMVFEQIRMIMKVVAFVSTKTRDCLRTTNSADKKKQSLELCPSLGTFMYFLFAPTIIYSDAYPRTKRIRWPYVASCLAQIFGCIQAGAAVFESALVASTRDFGSTIPITFTNFLYASLYNTFPAFAILGLITYVLFHCIQNAVGEMLRFADRQCYLDWWTQSTCSAYFRNAHILPQEWLNFYVYRPIKDATNSRVYAQVGVYVLSGIVHEIMFISMFRYFYPVTFVLFVMITGPIAYFDGSLGKTSMGNFCFLMAYPFSLGIMEVAYSVEFFARLNCPRTLDSTTDFFVPRSWFCNRTILPTKNASDWSLF